MESTASGGVAYRRACRVRRTDPQRQRGPGARDRDPSPEEALRAEATKFWEARIKGDMVTQYNLQEPKAREGVTLTAFTLARGTVVFLTYKITTVETAGDEGKVTAATTLRMNHPKMERFGAFDQIVSMLWVRQGGVWYVKGSQEAAGKPLKAGESPPRE